MNRMDTESRELSKPTTDPLEEVNGPRLHENTRDTSLLSSMTNDVSFTVSNNVLIVAIKLPNAPPNQDELPAMTLDFGSMSKVKPTEITALLGSEQIIPLPEDEEASHILHEGEVPMKDNEYYLDMVNFEFDDTKFLVPPWGFHLASEGSTLILPQEEDRAYTQADVSAIDFRGLMEFLYPLNSVKLSREAWISTLKLTSGWRMFQYQKQALEEIRSWRDGLSPTPAPLRPEEKIVLGRHCGVPAWYREGCISFAEGSAKFTRHHEASIGIDAMIKIARAQDAAYQPTYDVYHTRFSTPSALVRKVPTEISAEKEDTSSPVRGIVEEICQARRNNHIGWLRACYEQLIDRKESITLEEVALLGLDATISLWEARLALRKQYQHALGGFNSSPNPHFAACIETQFSSELMDIRIHQIEQTIGTFTLPATLTPPTAKTPSVGERRSPAAAGDDIDDRGSPKSSRKKKQLPSRFRR